jgi:tetratricopeptide (TPR) repeat protein
MKKNFLKILIASTFYFSISGCSLLDPTEVVNPNLTEDNVLGTGTTMTPWLGGLERQLALTYNELITINEIASDNYTNTETFYNQAFDVPTFNNTDTDINSLLFAISRLRESALYGITTVKPSDASTTPSQEAELYFYKGLAHLLLGELFVSAPAVPDGAPISPTEQINLAIADFKVALDLTTDAQNEAGYNIILARAYHAIGDKVNARIYANAAIAQTSNYVRYISFDGLNGPASEIQDALVDRGTFDDLQPLPRLDFLDPKFYAITASDDSKVPLIKIEEAHFILAEANLSDGLTGLPLALTNIRNALNIVSNRPRATFSDRVDGRTQDFPNSRPNTSAVTIAFGPGEPQISGLVLDRQAPTVTIPTISGSSISSSNVTVLNYPTIDAALELLYLIRQEVFIAEGRRFFDLGLKYPVSFNEIVSNPNINPDSPATLGRIPNFIPSAEGLDAFTYNTQAGTVVITNNMNKILVANKSNTAVIPFFN